jgi:hypothetical protein
MARLIALDRIQLDRLAFAPRSSTLHLGRGRRPELQDSPWWVYVAGERLPASVHAGHAAVAFRGMTTGGHELGGDVEIVERLDDAHGTRLVLSGRHPLSDHLIR